VDAGSDTTAPTITGQNLTLLASGPDGARVFFPVAVADDYDPEPTVTYSQPSGSLFPVGDTLVTVTATDAAGNRSEASFTVTVRQMDFAVTDLVVAGGSTHRPWDEITVTASVENFGGDPGAFLPPRDVTFYLSPDPTIDGSDILLGGTYAVGGSDRTRFTASFSFFPPSNLGPGKYYVVAVVSPGDLYDADASNNVRAVPIVFTPSPDRSYNLAADASLSVAPSDGFLTGMPVGAAVTLLTAPAHAGRFRLAPDGSFEYAPQAGFTGIDSFAVRISGNDWELTGTATIRVLAPITAAPDFYRVAAGRLDVSASLGVLANDSTPRRLGPLGQLLWAELATGPAHGQLTLNANGSFVYTPAAGFSGTDTFTYRARDPYLQSGSVLVTLAVTTGSSPAPQSQPAGPSVPTPLPGAGSAPPPVPGTGSIPFPVPILIPEQSGEEPVVPLQAVTGAPVGSPPTQPPPVNPPAGPIPVPRRRRNRPVRHVTARRPVPEQLGSATRIHRSLQ
jgi:hypothetical protein